MLTKLKQRAAPAGKDLAAALSNPNTSSRVRELAARSLAQIGRDASYSIPALVRGLNDPVDIVRECAARALGLVGSQRNAAELKHAMDTNRNWVTVAFVEALYALNPGDSNYAAGILRECIQDSNAYSKVYGSTVLWKIAKDANSTVPVLMQVLADTNSVGIHQWDIMQLGEMGSEAKAAVPLLEEKTRFEGDPRAKGIQEAAKLALLQIKKSQ
jgi:HEAT repeat protein